MRVRQPRVFALTTVVLVITVMSVHLLYFASPVPIQEALYISA